MKFTVQVTGEAALGLPEQDFAFEAVDGNAAVDLVRVDLAKLMPKEGGLLDVVVSCAEEWEKVSTTPKGGTLRETVPAGEVSSFSFRVEPHESVRAEVEAAAKAAEEAAAEAAEREALKLELRAEIAAETAAESAAGKAVSK